MNNVRQHMHQATFHPILAFLLLIHVIAFLSNSSTFQTNYLNQNITFDLWALHRGLAPRQDVVREAASFGYGRIECRPTALSKE